MWVYQNVQRLRWENTVGLLVVVVSQVDIGVWFVFFDLWSLSFRFRWRRCSRLRTAGRSIKVCFHRWLRNNICRLFYREKVTTALVAYIVFAHLSRSLSNIFPIRAIAEILIVDLWSFQRRSWSCLYSFSQPWKESDREIICYCLSSHLTIIFECITDWANTKPEPEFSTVCLPNNIFSLQYALRRCARLRGNQERLRNHRQGWKCWEFNEWFTRFCSRCEIEQTKSIDSQHKMFRILRISYGCQRKKWRDNTEAFCWSHFSDSGWHVSSTAGLDWQDDAGQAKTSAGTAILIASGAFQSRSRPLRSGFM